MEIIFADTVYLGDNLEVMRYMEDRSVDLIYMDPPYGSNRDYEYFEDRWDSFDHYIGFIKKRLCECNRILKDTGSFYLHCDSKFSHYLKVSCDEVFGYNNFRNEIVWCYTGPSNAKKRFPNKHDIILFYAAGKGNNTFNRDDVRIPYSNLKSGWHITKTGKAFGDREIDKERVLELNQKGKVPESWWVGLTKLDGKNKEQVGYPTQKPLSLLERIIKASSNEGDLVLDPFCGSGTALVAAKKLNRNYIGIDLSSKAVSISEQRLEEM